MDLNRNYGFEWSSEATGSGPAPFSEPETRAVRALSALAPFGAGLSAHAGATNLGWVWNHTHEPPLDEPLVARLAEVYAEACSQPGFYVTNGADWYPTNGDTNDWSYGVHGTLDFTLEVATDKHPDSALVPELLDHHRDAVLGFLAASSVSHGVVRDRATGLRCPQPCSGCGPAAAHGLVGPLGPPVDGRSEGAVSVSAHGFGGAEEVVPGVWELAAESVVPLTPVPALLSSDAVGCVQLSSATRGPVTLRRRGFPDQTLAWDASCEGIWVDAGELEPGAWSLEMAHGIAPRALHVGEADDLVQIASVSRSSNAWVLEGSGFAEGARDRVRDRCSPSSRASCALGLLQPDEAGQHARRRLRPARPSGPDQRSTADCGRPRWRGAGGHGSARRPQTSADPGTEDEEGGPTPPTPPQEPAGCATVGPGNETAWDSSFPSSPSPDGDDDEQHAARLLLPLPLLLGMGCERDDFYSEATFTENVARAHKNATRARFTSWPGSTASSWPSMSVVPTSSRPSTGRTTDRC